jgi:16S rRNA (guanine527-N7)-methyltransferase
MSAERPELPTDPRTLAPMGPAFDAAVDAGLAELHIDGGGAGADVARRSYEAHARLMRDWGKAINLTAIRDPGEVGHRHVIDALSAVPILERLALTRGARLLDIGSGAGYPGLPLAAALPLSHVGLLDSIRKKARFLAVAAEAVRTILPPDHAPVIEAIAERAEDQAEQPDQRESWDIVTSRAVGSLAEVVEISMPLARPGGVIVAWKREEERGGLRGELRLAGSIIRATGGGRPEIVAIEAGSLPGHRLVVIPKERATPASYPRPAGKRSKRKR